MTPPDAELARAAAGGDASSLGALLQRHHAKLLGLAVLLVGRDEASDVVHDAFLVALRTIGDLRDPDAAGAWLRTIVRTQALMRLRARREVPTERICELPAPPGAATPEEDIERTAVQDWVWAALERLTEPLRLVTMLRYFGARSSYEEIAAVLGVPVGTVRSRLNQARGKLANELLREASRAHPDFAKAHAAREGCFREAFDRANGGDFSAYTEDWARDVLGQSDGVQLRGRDALARALHDGTPAAGVRVHLERAITSSTVTVLELSLENPPDNPNHCPPASTQVHFHPKGPTERILLTYPSKAEPGASRPSPANRD